MHNLINGTTIVICDSSDLDEFEYFHIKLERHDVIYAEGAPCGTLLYIDERAVNFAEYPPPQAALPKKSEPSVVSGRRQRRRARNPFSRGLCA